MSSFVFVQAGGWRISLSNRVRLILDSPITHDHWIFFSTVAPRTFRRYKIIKPSYSQTRDDNGEGKIRKTLSEIGFFPSPPPVFARYTCNTGDLRYFIGNIKYQSLFASVVLDLCVRILFIIVALRSDI